MLPGMNLGDILQFGFAAVMALILLGTLKDLIPKLLTVIAANSTSMENVATAVGELTRSVERLQVTTAALERRIDRLDDTSPPKRIPVRG